MKARLTNIFGLKLLPVSGEMTSTAKDMLDQEIEYIDYLRNRKKFFFMTQVQQTRVHVVAKRKRKIQIEEEEVDSCFLLLREERRRSELRRLSKRRSSSRLE